VTGAPALHRLLAPHRTVAVVGLAKNAGKTTVINHLVERMDGPVGLVPLELDGGPAISSPACRSRGCGRVPGGRVTDR
jgi:hypothetical protein